MLRVAQSTTSRESEPYESTTRWPTTMLDVLTARRVPITSLLQNSSKRIRRSSRRISKDSVSSKAASRSSRALPGSSLLGQVHVPRPAQSGTSSSGSQAGMTQRTLSVGIPEQIQTICELSLLISTSPFFSRFPTARI